MLKAVFFDLDGTLLPMDEKYFIKVYISLLYEKVKHYGFKKDNLEKAIFFGLQEMYKNEGPLSNEQVFWDSFSSIIENKNNIDKDIFIDFYKNEFSQTKIACKDNPLAKTIINYVNDSEIQYCILSTNPIFPKEATLTRMKMVGLNEDDFDFITTYENSCSSKPNPLYFTSLLKKFNLLPEEVILFGNNDVEDFECAKKAGITCYLINNTLITHPEKKIDYITIKMEEIIPTIKKEIQNRKVH